MILKKDLIAASSKCLKSCRPFAIVILPDDDKIRFYSSDTAIPANSDNFCKSDAFIVSRFGLETEQKPLIIQPQYTIDDIIRTEFRAEFAGTENIDEKSTEFEEYARNIEYIVSQLAENNEKVVISRLIIALSVKDPFSVAEEYFSENTTCFRALYYTPQTGMWIVATPETLFDYDLMDSSLTTMALAGTRPAGTEEPWDRKNQCEHDLVTDYIRDTLQNQGFEVKVELPTNVRFGDIEHLCNNIKAAGSADPLGLAMRMSPTPAVCGWPVDKANRLIEETETYHRECYGGFLGIRDDDRIKLFVNLRSCKVMKAEDVFVYRLIAGGGINSMSDALSEWEEAGKKAERLKKIIEKGN